MATLNFKVNSIESFREAMNAGADFWDEHKYIQVKFSDKRSLNANALQHEWYKTIAKHYGVDEGEIKTFCKAKFGLRILLRRDPELVDLMNSIDWGKRATAWNMSIKEAKLLVVSKMLVTSEFTAEESNEYMDAIKQHYLSEGFVLPEKDD